ncbi:lipopolysaccharide cholinephosphotransferase [Weissella uvarum]|uniref:LicD family protein n=1 Tax=Weissella uvarum TaxID=1479233 RepID=UPI00196007B5|nr:LicD family protein [Weissella uvarum]MBM7616566.1 lipopolysaccharide cholinephosphotransferase [Weissella uvarum]MCM0594974.1 LicD family protein [Weissella uvarum]
MVASEDFLTIEEVHLYMLEILDDILDYLKQHNMTYVLTGGSALGAVRHHGFIPWDDDIDLAMPREEYDAFVANYRPTQPRLKLINLEQTDGSGIAYTRVANVQTGSQNELLNVNNGIFVDVFPLDHVPDQQSGQKSAYYRMKILDGLRNSTRRTAFNRDEPWWKVFIKQVTTSLVKHQSTDGYAAKIDRLARKVNEKNQTSHTMSLYVVQGINAMRENQSVEIYTTKRQPAVFEGRTVNIPGPGYLEKLFGPNYMQIPDEHKSHGNFYIRHDATQDGLG